MSTIEDFVYNLSVLRVQQALISLLILISKGPKSFLPLRRGARLLTTFRLAATFATFANQV